MLAMTRTLFALTLLLPFTAMAEQYTLVCHIKPASDKSLPALDVTYAVNLDAASVNGKLAVINDNTITWKTKTDRGTVQTAQVTRATGSLTAVDSTFGLTFTGHCVKATQRQPES
jgi:hypothetical protein